MNFLKLLTIVLLLLNFCQAQDFQDGQSEVTTSNDDYAFSSNKTSCAMYAETCQLFILVKNLRKLMFFPILSKSYHLNSGHD